MQRKWDELAHHLNGAHFLAVQRDYILITLHVCKDLMEFSVYLVV